MSVAHVATGRAERRRQHLSGRALAVFGVTSSFVAMLASGVFLYIAPRGRLAQEIDWQMLGLDRHAWQAVHIAVGILFAAFVLWHVLLHLRVFRPMLCGSGMHPDGHRREAAIALAALLLVAVTAALAWPPSQWGVDGRQYFSQIQRDAGALRGRDRP